MAIGKVYLLGAGPGDPELLTLKAARILGLADIILIDDLVNREILVHARTNVRLIEVGKRGGCRSTSQAFIERLMASQARSGAVVVRLKGGDPFIFGRGGEEQLALQKKGIAVEIVSGISSGQAAAASIGVPFTQRGMSQGVVFVTGHGQNEQPDWGKLANLGMTLVVYMGVARCSEIVSALIKGGMRPAIPVAVIQSASCENQRHLITNLENLPSDLLYAGLKSPACILIGDVISFSKEGQLKEIAMGHHQS